MAADPPHHGITGEGGSWDLVRKRLRQAQELHSFCESQTPRNTEIDDAPLAETKHWDLVSQSLRVCGHFAKGVHPRSAEERGVRHNKKKRSRWDTVRPRQVVTNDLESTPLQSPSTLSSASTVLAFVVASSRKQVAQGLLTAESADPTACPAELDASRWKEGWLRRKNCRGQGQGGLHTTHSTSAPLTHEPGLVCTRHGARHVMARCGGGANRPRGLAPHGRSFRPRTLSESNAALAGLTSFYKFVKAKYPHVRASSPHSPKSSRINLTPPKTLHSEA